FIVFVFFFQAEDGIRDRNVTGVQTCALPISRFAQDDIDYTKGLSCWLPRRNVGTKGLTRRVLKLSEIGEDFGAVFFGVYIEIGFADNAGRIDEKGMASRKFGDAQIY